MELSISAEQNDPESCVRIAKVMAKFQRLHKLIIRVWRESEIHAFLNALNDEHDSRMFSTVKELTICINEDVLQVGENKENDSTSELENFIGNFKNIKKLNSFPIDRFNPFTNINIENLEELVVDTPNTKKDMDIVSEFVSKSMINKLELRGIQSDPLSYDSMSKLKNIFLCVTFIYSMP